MTNISGMMCLFIISSNIRDLFILTSPVDVLNRVELGSIYEVFFNIPRGDASRDKYFGYSKGLL